MNPTDEWGSYCLMKHKKSFSPHIIPWTKGLEESLNSLGQQGSYRTRKCEGVSSFMNLPYFSKFLISYRNAM